MKDLVRELGHDGVWRKEWGREEQRLSLSERRGAGTKRLLKGRTGDGVIKVSGGWDRGVRREQSRGFCRRWSKRLQGQRRNQSGRGGVSDRGRCLIILGRRRRKHGIQDRERGGRKIAPSERAKGVVQESGGGGCRGGWRKEGGEIARDVLSGNGLMRSRA